VGKPLWHHHQAKKLIVVARRKMMKISPDKFLANPTDYTKEEIEDLEKELSVWLTNFRSWTRDIRPATPSPENVFRSASLLLHFSDRDKAEVLAKYYGVLKDNKYFYKLNSKNSKDRTVLRMCVETLFMANTELFMRNFLYSQALDQINLLKEVKRIQEVNGYGR